MTFYEHIFGEENKGLKSNTLIIKFFDRYDNNAQQFAIEEKNIKLSIEDVALTFRLPAIGVELLQIRKCNKQRVFLKHYSRDIKYVTRGSIEKAINKLLTTKERRTLKHVIEDEKCEQLHTLGEEINDAHKRAAMDFATMMILYMVCTLFFANNSIKITWSWVNQIMDMISLKAIN